MRSIRLLSFTVILSWALLPPNAWGQTPKENPDDFVKDVLLNLFGPNWNVSLGAGSNNHGRFALQRATLPGGSLGERTLRGADGYSVGIGVGMDLFLRMGFRLGYTYGNSDLVFRTDIGDGSEVLDADDLGELVNHTVSVELIRYLLPSTASMTPYGSAGFITTWYSVDGTALLGGGGTLFRTGALAVLGLKVEVNDRFDLRFEGATASVRNPFTGRDSYRIQGGVTVDEPTRVNRSNLRVLGVYNFGRPNPQLPTARRGKRR